MIRGIVLTMLIVFCMVIGLYIGESDVLGEGKQNVMGERARKIEDLQQSFLDEIGRIVPTLSNRAREQIAERVKKAFVEYLMRDIDQEEFDAIRKGLPQYLGQCAIEDSEACIDMLSEYIRWGISEFAQRPKISTDVRNKLESQVKEILEKAKVILQKEVASLEPVLIETAMRTSYERLTGNINNPLFPGLKKVLSDVDMSKALKALEEGLSEHREIQEELINHLGEVDIKNEDKLSDIIIVTGVEAPLMAVEEKLCYSGVNIPETLTAAAARYSAQKQQQFQEKMKVIREK